MLKVPGKLSMKRLCADAEIARNAIVRETTTSQNPNNPGCSSSGVKGLRPRQLLERTFFCARRTDGFGGKWELPWLDRLNRRSRLAGAEVFKENVGQDPHLARG
jgi:hypothetical protein